MSPRVELTPRSRAADKPWRGSVTIRNSPERATERPEIGGLLLLSTTTNSHSPGDKSWFNTASIARFRYASFGLYVHITTEIIGPSKYATSTSTTSYARGVPTEPASHDV